MTHRQRRRDSRAPATDGRSPPADKRANENLT
jgi:hypothetical protein